MTDTIETPSYIALDLRGLSAAELVKCVSGCLALLREGAPASEARVLAAVLIMLRQELQRRGDSDAPGGVQVLTGVPADAIEAAAGIISDLRETP